MSFVNHSNVAAIITCNSNLNNLKVDLIQTWKR